MQDGVLCATLKKKKEEKTCLSLVQPLRGAGGEVPALGEHLPERGQGNGHGRRIVLVMGAPLTLISSPIPLDSPHWGASNKEAPGMGQSPAP